MSSVLFCPGRTTFNHDQFLAKYKGLSEYRFLVLDTSTAGLAYASGSNELVLCANERYQLEMHKFLTIAPAHSYIKNLWENKYENGMDWKNRGRFVASFNNHHYPKVMKTWNDMAQYYCVLAMSGFRTNFRKWKLIAEHTPVTPDYQGIRLWSQAHKNKTIRYYKRNVYNFPTTELNEKTVIYIHLPDNFAPYGCGYAWTKRKLNHVARELIYFAEIGQPVVVSLTHTRWSRRNETVEELFPTNLFRTNHFTELKAQKPGFTPRPLTEAYLVANIG
jgi:hypothetical protein